MISTLRSIDSLLNRFDELSKSHDKFISNFDTHFSDIKNPLRHVSRTEDEQQKSTENLLLVVNESDDQFGSSQTLEDFHRRIIKSRYLHRPPSYSSNDISLIHRVPSRSFSITRESISFPRISQITNSQLVVVLTPNKNIIESKVDLTTKNKPKVVPRNSPSARGIITAFTKETASRLSKPKRYNRLPDQKPSIKTTVKQILKPYENIKKEASKCPTLPRINRIKTATIRPSSKKVIPIQTLSRNPVNNLSCPLVFVAPAPIIHLGFPIQPQQKTARFVNLPKIITTTKRSMPYLKT